MVLRTVFVSLILGTSIVLGQDSNSPNFFLFLTTSNKPFDFNSNTQYQNVNSNNEAEKKVEKPKGVTLPDGTFISNQPVKTSPLHKNKYEIYKTFVEKPQLAAEMAEQGVKLAQNALEDSNANPIIPLDNVRAMYAVSVFLAEGYYFQKNKDASLEWSTKAACAGSIKMNGGNRSESDKLSEQEISEAYKVLKSEIKTRVN